ncbi:MAG: hypothetical protein RL141_920 [Candidatus Parcubacteria bacterium]|jgi:drug/metabolite transporter (DMT)-like permease
MIGVILVFISALLAEISNAMGKFAFAHKLEQPAMMGFLNTGWVVGYFALIALFVPGGFHLVPATIPWLGVLIFLGGLQTVVSLFALRRASRSTFGLLRALTIPALALIDLGTGVALSPLKLVAMGLMCASIMWLHRNHGIDRRGAGLVLFTAMNGAVTIAMLKQVLNMGTSVAAAQLFILVPILFFLAAWSLRSAHTHFKGHGTLLSIQTASYGAASLVGSYALPFAPASVIATALRASEVLWAIISGKVAFHEDHVKEKLIGGGAILIGLLLLAFG